MSGLVPLGSFALAFATWPGYYTAQTTYIHNQNILGFPWQKQCIALVPHPLQFAKNLPSGPSMSSILLSIGFQWILLSREADRSLSWFWHSAYECQCKSTDLHLSFTPIQLYYTMGFDWGI